MALSKKKLPKYSKSHQVNKLTKKRNFTKVAKLKKSKKKNSQNGGRKKKKSSKKKKKGFKKKVAQIGGMEASAALQATQDGEKKTVDIQKLLAVMSLEPNIKGSAETPNFEEMAEKLKGSDDLTEQRIKFIQLCKKKILEYQEQSIRTIGGNIQFDLQHLDRHLSLPRQGTTIKSQEELFLEKLKYINEKISQEASQESQSPLNVATEQLSVLVESLLTEGLNLRWFDLVNLILAYDFSQDIFLGSSISVPKLQFQLYKLCLQILDKITNERFKDMLSHNPRTRGSPSIELVIMTSIYNLEKRVTNPAVELTNFNAILRYLVHQAQIEFPNILPSQGPGYRNTTHLRELLGAVLAARLTHLKINLVLENSQQKFDSQIQQYLDIISKLEALIREAKENQDRVNLTQLKERYHKIIDEAIRGKGKRKRPVVEVGVGKASNLKRRASNYSLGTE